MQKKYIGFFLGIAAFLAILFFADLEPGKPEVTATMAFMLPTATPPNAIIFGTNRINIGTMVRTGFMLNMLGIVVVVIVTRLLGSAIFDIQPGVLPVWLN